jgi:hypothetical protein
MKNTLVVLFLLFITQCNAQEINVISPTPNHFTFEHTRVLSDEQKVRFEYRMKTECPSLETIVFIDNKCSFTLKNNLTQEDIDNAIIYCTTKFGFSSYNITTL